jgi:SSS family transporter
MKITPIDWVIIVAFFAFTLLIGFWASKKAGRSAKDYFLSGREMPWWLLGVSMVATTFSADTPNLVTDIVRKNGVAGNWVWWAFLLTGMATVFIYAKLWRRSGITTDLEFYELRYSGPEASFLRGFRAIYLGVFFNIMIMASVLLAGIKISGIMLGISPVQTVLLVSLVTVIYSSLGGLRGVILTDFFQFILSMIGMIAAAIYIINLPEIGSVSNLITHPNVADKINFIPDFNDPNIYIPLLIIPLAVQWWSIWYPGAEPGGGGYIAQRMLSAKDEKDAIKATLFFNAAHYALRPWPWILIALASLIIFPELESMKASFPDIDDSILAHDLAFPAMLTFLPKGLLGLVIAALIAALMSTISTHLNWGSSYIVNDFYLRFINKNADQKTQVNIGRISTLLLMICAAIFALFLTSAMEIFNILLQIGAGTGLLFLLRWFWWRINAYSEITAMVVSFIIALFFELVYEGTLQPYQKMCIGILITTIAWIAATYLSRPTDMNTLTKFYTLIRPHNNGWTPVINQLDMMDSAEYEDNDLLSVDHSLKYNSDSDINIDQSESRLSQEILMMFLGCVMVYTALFSTGKFLYGEYIIGLVLALISSVCAFLISKIFKS